MTNKPPINRYKFWAALILLVAQFLTPQSGLANSETTYTTLSWEDLAPSFPDLDRLRGGENLSAIELHHVYQKIWDPENIVEELEGKAVRIPGFIVPLEFDEEQRVTQFFLVPYHGACIHAPAPPPNQLIMGNYPEGLELESLDTSYWVSGEMTIEIAENELGTSGYGLLAHEFELYTD